ncbi:MAG: hypothetical protein IJ278_05590 [Clostridia bacterium]|nr:hypothetical protein [Clostridia bacterium]
MFSCNCNNGCIGLSVIASIIIGVIAAFLQITAAIVVTPAFLWVLFGIAVGYLAITLIAVALLRGNGLRSCVCRILPAVFIGILGTVLAAVILLAITFAATSIVGAIITGALLFFFALLISATVCLVTCAAGCSDSN